LPDHRKLILFSVVALAAWFFIEYFLLHDWLPEKIPNTPINITGLYILVGIWATFYLLFKKILKDNPEVSFFYLVTLGFLIGLLSELIFQFYKQFTFTDITPVERMQFFFYGVFGIAICAALMAFPIALNMKYKNKWWTGFAIIGVFVVAKYTAEYFGILKA
jgi:hypothetical protein